MKERLLKRIVKTPNGCWEWQGALRNGYGAIKVDGKVVDTHRVSYRFFVGNIPDGQLVCHKCDNRRCINPDHLFIGTHSDNMKDAYKKGRLNLPIKGRFDNGHTPKNKKYTEEQLQEVLRYIEDNPDRNMMSICRELDFPYKSLIDYRRGVNKK